MSENTKIDKPNLDILDIIGIMSALAAGKISAEEADHLFPTASHDLPKYIAKGTVLGKAAGMEIRMRQFLEVQP